jgi:hypothetical protein
MDPPPKTASELARRILGDPKAAKHVTGLWGERTLREVFSNKNERVNKLAASDRTVVCWWGSIGE